MKYQSPALWRPTDPEIAESLPDHITDTGEINEWLVKEAQRRNTALLDASLGQSTGWPSKWAQEASTEPYGAEWKASLIRAVGIVENNGILILHGKRGGGKTRMAAELALAIGQSRYRTAMRFFLELRASYKDKEVSEMDIIDDLTRARILIIDELQERGDTPFEDRLLTHLIDARYAENRPTVLIANLTRKELAESLGASIIDRIRENGTSIEFTWPSFRIKAPNPATP